MDNTTILQYLRRMDPSGWEHKEPTPEDEDAFRQYVNRMYGHEMWAEYISDWDKGVYV